MQSSPERDPLDLWRNIDDAVSREVQRVRVPVTRRTRLASAPLLAEALARLPPLPAPPAEPAARPPLPAIAVRPRTVAPV